MHQGDCSGSVRSLGVWSHTAIGPTASFLLGVGDEQLLIDLGSDPVARLQEVGESPNSIDHVFVSHVHSDHSSGFANFVFTRGLLARELGEQLAPLNVYADETTLSSMKTILRLTYPDRQLDVAWQAVTPEASAKVGNMELVFHPIDHTVPGLSMVAKVKGVPVLGYQADSRPVPFYETFFSGCQTLILEAFSLGTDMGDRRATHEKGHSTAVDSAELARAASAKRVLPYHLPRAFRIEKHYQELVMRILRESGAEALSPLVPGPYSSSDTTTAAATD